MESRARERDEARRRWIRPLLLLLLLSLGISGCSNHYLLHPKTTPSEVREWSEEIVGGDLKARLIWARPAGKGPFPVVIVHPEARHVAKEMRGIIRSLAEEGFLAVAVDYQRRIRGSFRNTLFHWRDPEDVRLVIDHVRAQPQVDPRRIAAMGYSQGGVYSLLIAAEWPSMAAVVAYYPVTDFYAWLMDSERRGIGRLVLKGLKWAFKRKSGTSTDAELELYLERASPYRQAERIQAPVLLVHGDRDTTAPIAESEQMIARLRELGRHAELLRIEGAGHVFNFQDRRLASQAWETSLGWLRQHLGLDPSGPGQSTSGSQDATESRRLH